MEVFQFGRYQVELFLPEIGNCEQAIWLLASSGEGDCVWDLLEEKFPLFVLSGLDWNRDLSPWAADRLYASSEPFSGGADDFLRQLVGKIVPECEQALPSSPKERAIAGYSMAGLFSLYAIYRCTEFVRAASVSGSLWFDGWEEYALTNRTAVPCPKLYLSLGNKEHRVRNPRMASVRDCTERLAAEWRRRGFPTLFEINPGGHFQEPELRTARALTRLLSL